MTFSWEFGDGGMGNGATPAHAYAAEGDYTVTLTVSDDKNESSIAMSTATIRSAPANRVPVANRNNFV